MGEGSQSCSEPDAASPHRTKHCLGSLHGGSSPFISDCLSDSHEHPLPELSSHYHTSKPDSEVLEVSGLPVSILTHERHSSLSPVVLDLLERVNVSVLSPGPVSILVTRAELESRIALKLGRVLAVVSLRIIVAV